MEDPAGPGSLRHRRRLRAAIRRARGQPGLYNGFLAAGLIWSLIPSDSTGYQVSVFFLLCVILAGVFGAATVNRRILYIQAIPATLALIAVFLSQ